MAGIGFLSWAGAKEMGGTQAHETKRLATYASTAVSQVLMVLWVWFGLKLRKVRFISLFGDLSGGMKSLVIDLGSAIVFWIGSMIVLTSIGMAWLVTEMAIKHQSLFPHGGKPVPPDPQQQHLIHTLTSLAPSNGVEVLAWAGMCLMAGVVEELVFRGYFQRQFTAWGRGALWTGIVFSALLFGTAHGYQGLRNMVMLSVFGALFSGLVIVRRNLRAGIIAHAWHDFFIGLVLAFLHWKHLV